MYGNCTLRTPGKCAFLGSVDLDSDLIVMHIDLHVDSTRTSTVQCTCIIAFIGIISLVSRAFVVAPKQKVDQNIRSYIMMTETERTNGEKNLRPKSSRSSTLIQHSTRNSPFLIKEGRHMHGGLLSLDRFQIPPLAITTLLGDILLKQGARVVGSGSVRRNPIPARVVQEI